MPPFGRAVWIVCLLTFHGAPALAQVRGLGEVGGGIGSAAGAGAVVTMPTIPNLNTNLGTIQGLSAPPQIQTLSAPPAAAAPARAAPAASEGQSQPVVAATPATPEPAPAARLPLLWASGWTADSATRCDMSDAARETCSGPDCKLSCAANVCPGQENGYCEFVIDCAAEIISDIATGDQPCDEASIEETTVSTDSGMVRVNIIHIAAGESCKPPPCSK